MSLANKYRPRDFESVMDQPHPVRFLSGHIKYRLPAESVLLHGAIGSGKTSLARIYARALNCDAPTASGSPCNNCPPCRTLTMDDYEYDTAGRGGDEKMVSEWISPRLRSPTHHRWTVLFFDEAQALKPAAADAILKAVEEPPERVIFCFATSAYEKIRPALRSRLIGFEIKPLSASEAVKLLERVAERENIPHDKGALELLAGLRQGYARDLLHGLEQVRNSDGAPITIARVREIFDVDHTQQLLAYAQSLAEGDQAKQNAAWYDWQEAAALKLCWLQALLTSLYYNNVLGQQLIVDALIASIQLQERMPVLDAFRKRLGVPTVIALAPYWRALMAKCPTAGAGIGETALQLRVALFHDFVNHDLPASLLSQDGAGGPPAQKPPVPVLIDRAVSGPPSVHTSRFPVIDDVRFVIASASFLMQEFHCLFNASVIVRPALYGIDEEVAAVSCVNEFCRDLEAEVDDWSDGLFARLTLLERDIDCGGQVAGRIIIHLPEPSESGQRFTEWVSSWRCKARLSVEEAVTVRTQATSKIRPLKFHWDNTLDLCAGLSDESMKWDPERRARRPLTDLLGITAKRTVGAIAAPLLSWSDCLDPSVIERACTNGMSLLSAFESEQWNFIRTGWEFDEHKDRMRLKAERAATLTKLMRTYGDTVATRRECNDLIASWQCPPEERPGRTWRGWWLPKDA